MNAATRLFLQHSTIQGIFLGLGAFAVWCLNDTATKFVGKGEVPYLQMICLIALGAILFLAIVSLMRGGLDHLKPRNLKLQTAQGGLTLVQSIVSVVTFTQLPLTTVYAALFTAPMIVAIGARLILRETLTQKQFALIFIGFCGALLAVNPFNADLNGSSALGWILLPLYPLLFATSTLIVRRLRLTDTNEATAAFPSLFRLVIFLPIAMRFWEPMSMFQIGACLLGGAFLGLGNMLFNEALTKTDSAIVSPLHYSQLVWGGLLGFLFWGDIPDWQLYVGSAIIIVSGVAGARLAYLRHKSEAAIAVV